MYPIEKFKELESAATPGPWVRETEWDDEDQAEVPSLGIRGQEYLQKGYEENGPVSDCICQLGFSAHDKHLANLQLILGMRNFTPEFLALWRAALNADHYLGNEIREALAALEVKASLL